jgi:hypothetical protein
VSRIVVVCVCVVVIIGPITALTAIGSSHSTGGFASEPVENQISSGTGITPEDEKAESNTNQTATKPGAQFVGVIGAHREQHEGEVSEQRVDVRISRADSPEEEAEIVATTHQQNQQRLDRLAERKQELRQAYQNGTITASEYRARSAVLDVELRSVERTAIQLERVADDLSISLLLEVGVDLEAIQDLQVRAHELQGTELPTIAPSFARDSNDSATDSPGPGDNESTNETLTDGNMSGNVSAALEDAETEVQTAREQVAEANQTIDETLATNTVTDLLEQARHNLSMAEQKLAAARTAREVDDDQKAIELANESIRFARTATELAEAAIEEATESDTL